MTESPGWHPTTPAPQPEPPQPGLLLPGQTLPGPPPWAWVRPTNTKAILAISLLWVPVASIILGVQARREIARTGEGGLGLASWGLGLGIAVASCYALYVVFFVVYVVGILAIVGGGVWSGGLSGR